MNRKLQSVLVVEDDGDIQEIIRASLETIGGLSVRICSSGIDALEILNSELPDLILLDWMMPGHDGGAVIERIRAEPRTSELPVVILTGKALPKEVSKMRSAGANEVISKPFDPIALPSLLSSVFDRSVC